MVNSCRLRRSLFLDPPEHYHAQSLFSIHCVVPQTVAAIDILHLHVVNSGQCLTKHSSNKVALSAVV